MPNNRLIIKVLMGLATAVLAVLLWYATIYTYENYLSKIFTISLPVGAAIILLEILLAAGIIYLILRLIRGLVAFAATYTLTESIIGIIGVILGLRLAWVLEFILVKIPFVGEYLLVFISIVFGTFGWLESIKRKDEILAFIGKGKKEEAQSRKVADTSVIIDGRLADMAKTGFLEGLVVIPDFVIDELQRLADSADDLKRAKGRQGLDTIKRIQSEKFIRIQIEETRDDGIATITETDGKLIRLMTLKGGQLITNDFNLNKVAGVQGIQVLNINELANALKPKLLPGEEFYLQIIKKGKEASQGVGYLDDGTMIIVEKGSSHVGEEVLAEVTSIMQTSAGRLIFARIKEA